jgi:hypothetical protein
MKIALVTLLAVSASLHSAESQAAGVQCAAHKQIVTLLTKKYSEEPVAAGTVNDDRYMQLFVSSSGSWTILVTKVDGQSCIVASGENWEKLPGIDRRPAA